MPRVSTDINTLLLSADKAAARANLDLEPGTDVLAFAAAASQAEMEAGTEAALRTMSPLRVAQAIAALSSGGGGEITVQDEGVSLATAATTINFVGAGVTASGTGATKTITISGAAVDLSSYVQSDITGLTGGTEIYNIVGITKAGYALIGTPDANTYYVITDASMGNYGSPVLGEWTADTDSTAATPDAGQLRWDNATQTSAANLYIDGVTAGGIDMAAIFLMVGNGDRILIQSGAANYQIWQLTGAPSVSSGNWTFPVILLSSDGSGTTGFADAAALIVGTARGGVPVFFETHASSHTLSPAECYGAVYTITSAATLTLPAGKLGMSLTVTTRGAVAGSVKAGASDFIYLDGVALDDGDKITNTSLSGDTVVLFADASGNWTAITDGNWTDTGA